MLLALFSMVITDKEVAPGKTIQYPNVEMFTWYTPVALVDGCIYYGGCIAIGLGTASQVTKGHAC